MLASDWMLRLNCGVLLLLTAAASRNGFGWLQVLDSGQSRSGLQHFYCFRNNNVVIQPSLYRPYEECVCVCARARARGRVFVLYIILFNITLLKYQKETVADLLPTFTNSPLFAGWWRCCGHREGRKSTAPLSCFDGTLQTCTPASSSCTQHMSSFCSKA